MTKLNEQALEAAAETADIAIKKVMDRRNPTTLKINDLVSQIILSYLAALPPVDEHKIIDAAIFAFNAEAERRVKESEAKNGERYYEEFDTGACITFMVKAILPLIRGEG